MRNSMLYKSMVNMEQFSILYAEVWSETWLVPAATKRYFFARFN